jgi:hypothetical protein
MILCNNKEAAYTHNPFMTSLHTTVKEYKLEDLQRFSK